MEGAIGPCLPANSLSPLIVILWIPLGEFNSSFGVVRERQPGDIEQLARQIRNLTAGAAVGDHHHFLDQQFREARD
jgi:hypothetical protein